jgi:hypothetical protein
MKYGVLLVFAIVILMRCKEAEKEKLIVGDWKGALWTSVTGAKQDVSNVSFLFDKEGMYAYTNGAVKEKGKYYLDSDNLHTTPDGGSEMMVKVEKLTKDSLVFNMNRGGQAEELTLVRK